MNDVVRVIHRLNDAGVAATRGGDASSHGEEDRVNAEFLGAAEEPVEWHLTLRLLTLGEQIRAARKVAAMSVRAVHGSDEDAAAVELAVGEILTNARLHAYAGGEGWSS
jgi:hypothetical protein